MFCGVSVTLNFTSILWSCKVKFPSSELLNLCVQAEVQRQTCFWLARVSNSDQDLFGFLGLTLLCGGNVSHESFL
jgi:hypothetical protein